MGIARGRTRKQYARSPNWLLRSGRASAEHMGYWCGPRGRSEHSTWRQLNMSSSLQNRKSLGALCRRLECEKRGERCQERIGAWDTRRRRARAVRSSVNTDAEGAASTYCFGIHDAALTTEPAAQIMYPIHTRSCQIYSSFTAAWNKTTASDVPEKDPRAATTPRRRRTAERRDGQCAARFGRRVGQRGLGEHIV